jgi:hypothetical protein
MATAQKPEGTAVATTDKKRVLDLDNAKTEQRFVEAFSKGQLDKLGTNEQSMFLMAFGAKIGLRAELGELMLYQGKPYITIAGKERNAHRSGLLAGVQPRPATALERKQFGATDDEVLWVCDVYRHGAPRSFRGWGVVNTKTDRNPVAKTSPRQMAKKRAKYDALSLAFPVDETIGQMHQKYIDTAEEIVRTQMTTTARMVEQPDEMADVEIEDGVRDDDDTGTDEEMGTGDLSTLLGNDAETKEHKDALRDRS